MDDATMPATPRARRGWTAVGASALAGAAVAGVGVATHYARLLTDPPTAVPEDPPRDDDRVRLVVVGSDHVIVTGDGAGTPGVWGVATPGGYGRLGPVEAITPAGVRRGLEVLTGTITPDHGVLDAYAAVNRPGDLHPHATEVVVHGEVGPLPAHQAVGDDLWAIGVHGRAAARHETFRMLRPIVAAGHSALAVSYRNDQDAPPSPDGRSHLGATEWRDVEAAMHHARRHGARRLLLVGCSMGGAIVGQVVTHGDTADVVGVVLDAPVVDWGPVAAQAARDLGVPGIAVSLLMGPTRAVARARHSVDLAALRFDPGVLTVPTLLVHGVADPVVPVRGSDALAASRPDVVSYLRIPDAGHVRGWNADPGTYDAALQSLLDRVSRRLPSPHSTGPARPAGARR